MLLDATTKLLKAVLSGAASPAPQFVATYRDIDQNGDETWGQTEIVANGTTEVTLAAAPSDVTKRVIEAVHCHNADNAQVTVSIFVDDGTTNWICGYFVLETLETCHYTRNGGWKCLATDGAIKNDT